jgi:hypothetical protein
MVHVMLDESPWAHRKMIDFGRIEDGTNQEQG